MPPLVIPFVAGRDTEEALPAGCPDMIRACYSEIGGELSKGQHDDVPDGV